MAKKIYDVIYTAKVHVTIEAEDASNAMLEADAMNIFAMKLHDDIMIDDLEHYDVIEY